jgi:malate dehydrogenase (oxaloacetate-decarboxylating)
MSSSEEIRRLLSESEEGTDETALRLHRALAGKISIAPKIELTEETLELLYTPGVGAPSRALADDAGELRALTWKGNSVAVVSDGSAVLGLGDEGPAAALPGARGQGAAVPRSGRY